MIITGLSSRRGDVAVAVAVLAKQPVRGRVKTRLCPPYTIDEATRLAAAALADTLDALDAARVTDRLLVIDGDPSAWRRPGWRILRQRGSGLADRLDNAMTDAARVTRRPVLIVGMDTPQLHPALVEAAASALLGSDAVLGPAGDGGFWALGVRVGQAGLCTGVPMSSSDTGRHQLDRLRARGLRPVILDELTDVDDASSAGEVAALAPDTQFARLLFDLARPASRLTLAGGPP